MQQHKVSVRFRIGGITLGLRKNRNVKQLKRSVSFWNTIVILSSVTATLLTFIGYTMSSKTGESYFGLSQALVGFVLVIIVFYCILHYKAVKLDALMSNRNER